MDLLADETHEIPIREGVELHLSQLGHELTYQGEGDITYENAQARMRTYLLMDAANMKNALVVGRSWRLDGVPIMGTICPCMW